MGEGGGAGAGGMEGRGGRRDGGEERRGGGHGGAHPKAAGVRLRRHSAQGRVWLAGPGTKSRPEVCLGGLLVPLRQKVLECLIHS